MLSGSGQMAGSPSFLINDPLVVKAVDANGNAVAGVGISWVITTGNGTLPDASLVTDNNGLATTHFTTSGLQPQQSFQENVVTATGTKGSTKYGSTSFFVIGVPTLNIDGTQAEPPTVTLLKPVPGSTITGLQGSTLPDAVEVRVQAGYGAQTNAPIPNVSVQLVNALDPTQPATGHCNGPNGTVYTDSTGTAKCDLVITGKPGQLSLGADTGRFHTTPTFILQVNAGPVCTFTLSSSSLAIASKGGTGSVKVTAAGGCGWAATSNVDWIAITSGASGIGNGTVAFTVGASASGARTGTLTIAGKTFTVNEGSGGGVLTITTPANLPGGAVNQSYSTTLAAAGGVEPYTWSIASGALPQGLTLNASSGLISGAATSAGLASFTASVKDSAGVTAVQPFSITITAASSTFVITNSSFPNGVISQVYKQALTSSGGVVTPFNQNPSFQVSGGALPDGLKIVKAPDLSSSISGTPTAAGLFNFTLTATDAVSDTASANFSITITGTPTSETMTVAPASLSFTIQLGSPNIPAVQPLSVTGNSGVLAYTSVITTTTGGSWLVAQNSTSGNTPGSISIGVANYSNLAAGTYDGTVTVSSAASNSPVAVPVTLTVLEAPALNVSLHQITLSQGQTSGSNVMMQTIQVTAGTSQTAGSAQPKDTPPAVSFSASATTNKGGNWLSVSPTTGTTPANLTISIDSGGLGVGTYAGSVMVTPTAGSPQIVSVTLNVINPQMLSATPAPVSFLYAQGAPAPAAQTVTVSASTGPPLTLTTTVATTDKGNWLSVNPPSGATPLDLAISVDPTNLKPGTYQGTVTVAASDSAVTPLPIAVTLNVSTPRPTINAVVNAASFVTGPVAPGEFVTIFGFGLGPDTPLAFTGSGTIGRTLGTTQVFFGTTLAPIIYTSSTQVSVIVPYELASSSSTNLTVWFQGNASAGDNLRVVDAAPGIFMLNLAGQGAIINQDNTVNSSSNGALVGSTISIYATGQGQTNPPGVDGAISQDASPQPPPLAVTVQIGGLPAQVSYAGAAPGAPAGFMQVNAVIPDGVPKGSSVPVVMTVGTAASQSNATVAIHP
jgi:uncharacterized protein (TIGR03437 family)